MASAELDSKSIAILQLLADGQSSADILDGHPAISRQDIALAARRALRLATTAPKQTYSLKAMRKKHARAYEKWLPEEEQRLRELFRAGKSAEEIAAALERQPSAIRSRLDRFAGGTTREPDRSEPAADAPAPHTRGRRHR